MAEEIFRREIDGNELVAVFDAETKSLSIEANGQLMFLLRVDRKGDVIGYTPSKDFESVE
jgi:hypothetical protein